MSRELDFNEDRGALVDYVMDQMVLWRENADEQAGRYLDYLIDADYDLYCEADDAFAVFEAYYLG